MERPDGTLRDITKENEAAIDHKIEKSFRSQREVPTGRNFMAWTLRWRDMLGDRFDQTFRGSPSTKEWMDDKFCSGCDMRKWACICGTGKKKPEPRFLVPRGSKVK